MYSIEPKFTWEMYVDWVEAIYVLLCRIKLKYVRKTLNETTLTGATLMEMSSTWRPKRIKEIQLTLFRWFWHQLLPWQSTLGYTEWRTLGSRVAKIKLWMVLYSLLSLEASAVCTQDDLPQLATVAILYPISSIHFAENVWRLQCAEYSLTSVCGLHFAEIRLYKWHLDNAHAATQTQTTMERKLIRYCDTKKKCAFSLVIRPTTKMLKCDEQTGEANSLNDWITE